MSKETWNDHEWDLDLFLGIIAVDIADQEKARSEYGKGISKGSEITCRTVIARLLDHLEIIKPMFYNFKLRSRREKYINLRIDHHIKEKNNVSKT